MFASYALHIKLTKQTQKSGVAGPARGRADPVMNTGWCQADTGRRLVVELAGLLVEGCSLLDGAEASDAEGLTGLGDGLGPAADVLECALAGGVGFLGDDLAGLVLHQEALLVSRLGLLACAGPHLSLGSTDADATGHIEVCFCLRAGRTILFAMLVCEYTEVKF